MKPLTRTMTDEEIAAWEDRVRSGEFTASDWNTRVHILIDVIKAAGIAPATLVRHQRHGNATCPYCQKALDAQIIQNRSEADEL